MMQLRLSAREKPMLIAVSLFGVAMLWMYVTLVIQPLMRHAGQLKQRVHSAREQLKSLELSTANEAALRQQQAQLEEIVTSLRNVLPPEEELPIVIELLSDLGSQSQVKIQSIFPQRPTGRQDRTERLVATGSAPVVYKEVLIQVDALAGYHQLGAFLSAVEESDRPLQVSSLRIAGSAKGSKRLQIKLVIQAYFAVSEAESARERGMAHSANPV